jgi:hypothetical protein
LRSLSIALILGLMPPLTCRAAELVPMYQFSLMGGQYFISGDRGNLSGNATANVAPAVKLDDRWTILPIYDGYYRGTKPVTDPVGSGTLFQQLFDNRVSIGGLYSVPDSQWKLKPSLSYKYELIKETRDESWGKGLFDYGKAGASFEAERVYQEPFSVRIGYDFYYIRFPHFQSLESKSGVDPSGNPLGRETAGARVLDTINNQVTVTATMPYPFDDPLVSLMGSYSFLFQYFPDQPLVNSSGQYLPRNRRDYSNSLSATILWPKSLYGDRLRLSAVLQGGMCFNGSDQNTYDANNTKYIPDAYSYFLFYAGPSLNASWGDQKNPSTAGVGFTATRTYYTHRLTQLANGLYTPDAQVQGRYMWTLNYGYPVAPDFRLTANLAFLLARSNMAYETTYKYNYLASSYLFGFAYDY